MKGEWSGTVMLVGRVSREMQQSIDGGEEDRLVAFSFLFFFWVIQCCNVSSGIWAISTSIRVLSYGSRAEKIPCQVPDPGSYDKMCQAMLGPFQSQQQEPQKLTMANVNICYDRLVYNTYSLNCSKQLRREASVPTPNTENLRWHRLQWFFGDVSCWVGLRLGWL